MKKAFLYAYDKVNLGDDLFIHMITKRYPGVQFYFRTDTINKITFRQLTNLKILDKDTLFPKILKRIRGSFIARYNRWWEQQCQVAIYIGGSIYMEYDTSPGFLEWLSYQTEQQPFFSIGANFGPYRTEEYKQKLACIFEKMRDVCFRDYWSCKQFSDCRYVRYAPDILFSYPIKECLVRDKQIFVSVINCEERDSGSLFFDMDNQYVINMAFILKQYLDDGCSLVLGAFCKNEGDDKAINKILNEMDCIDDSRIKVLIYDGTNVEELLCAIAESAYVIASRFHATILAMTAGRPVLPLIYSDKTWNVLMDLQYDGVVYDLRKIGAWDYHESRKNWDNPSFVLPNSIKSLAEEHFRELDKLLIE